MGCSVFICLQRRLRAGCTKVTRSSCSSDILGWREKHCHGNGQLQGDHRGNGRASFEPRVLNCSCLIVLFSVVLCGLDILIHTLSKPLSCGCSRSSLHSEDITLWGKGATDLLLPDLLYPPSDLGALPLFSAALMPIGHTCGLC